MGKERTTMEEDIYYYYNKYKYIKVEVSVNE